MLLRECVVITFSRLGINRVWLSMLLLVNWKRKLDFSLSRPASAGSFSTPGLNTAFTHGTPLLPASR